MSHQAVRPGVSFTREQVEAWVGHPLTDEQVADIQEVAPNSSIPDAIETIAHVALEFDRLEESDDTARCPVCGEPIDYCQGHGAIGDPLGYAKMVGHDDGRHGVCHPAGCADAGKPVLS